MKTLNTITAIAIILSTALVSCSKEAAGPSGSGNNGQQPITSVVAASWFSAAWQQNGQVKEFTTNVSQLGIDIIKDGKVLLFGKGGFEMRVPTILPAHFDANYITASSQVGQVTLTLQGSGAISPALQFRYILIPSNKLANNLDYGDYNAVCDYYRITK